MFRWFFYLNQGAFHLRQVVPLQNLLYPWNFFGSAAPSPRDKGTAIANHDRRHQSQNGQSNVSHLGVDYSCIELTTRLSRTESFQTGLISLILYAYQRSIFVNDRKTVCLVFQWWTTQYLENRKRGHSRRYPRDKFGPCVKLLFSFPQSWIGLIWCGERPIERGAWVFSKAKPGPQMQYMLETPFTNGQHLLSNAQNGALIVLTVQTAIVIHALPKVGLTKKYEQYT